MMLAIVGISAAPQTQFYKTLKTGNFELIDRNGDTSAVFQADKDGSTTFFMLPDAEGTCPILIGADPDGIGTFVLGGMPEVGKGVALGYGICLTNEPKYGCGLHITDAEDLDRVTAVVNGSRPEIWLYDSEVDSRLAGCIDKDDSTVFDLFSGGKEKGTAELSVSPDSSSCLYLTKEISAETGTLCSGVRVYANDKTAGTVLSVTGANGKDRVNLSCPQDKSARLVFLDAKETQRLSAATIYNDSALIFQGREGDIDMYLYDSASERPVISFCDGEREPDIITDKESTTSGATKINTIRKTE